MNKLDNQLEKIFTILAIIGSTMIANEIHTGWVIFLLSSTFQLIWSYRKKLNYMMLLSVFFLLNNSIGIYNYLVK